MGMFSKLFGSKKISGEKSNPDINRLVHEASHIADELIDRELVGGAIMTSSTVAMGSDSPLTKAIDRVLELAPENADFLFAKSEAHYARMDGETGQEYRKKTLSVNPDHFDANMRQDYFQQWDHLFIYPGWNEQSKKVPDLMLALQAKQNPVQLVRDGLEIKLIILIPTPKSEFPEEVIDYRWKPLWVDTPHGPVFEHYVMLKLSSGQIYRQEMTISPYPIEPIHARHGNWIIRRMWETDSIFICFNDGEDVIYNQRYNFSKSVQSTLSTIKYKLENLNLPSDYNSKFQMAAQWYMQNSSLDDIAW